MVPRLPLRGLFFFSKNLPSAEAVNFSAAILWRPPAGTCGKPGSPFNLEDDFSPMIRKSRSSLAIGFTLETFEDDDKPKVMME